MKRGARGGNDFFAFEGRPRGPPGIAFCPHSLTDRPRRGLAVSDSPRARLVVRWWGRWQIYTAPGGGGVLNLWDIYLTRPPAREHAAPLFIPSRRVSRPGRPEHCIACLLGEGRVWPSAD